MEASLSSGEPEEAVTALPVLLSEPRPYRAPVLPRSAMPPLAEGRARPSRVTLRHLSADVAQSLTTISQRGIDCLIDADADADADVDVDVDSGKAAAADAHGRTGTDVASRGWRLSLSAGIAQPLRDACDREAIIDWSGAWMRLSYRNAAALSWLAARLNIDGDMPLDDASAQALRAAALNDLIGRLALTGLGVPHVVGDRVREPGRATSESSTTSPTSEAFSFVVLLQPLHDARRTILAVLETDAFGVNLLASLLQSRAERPLRASRDATSIVGETIDREDAAMRERESGSAAAGRLAMSMLTRVVLPPVRLSLGEARALSSGDIVLLGVPSVSVPRGTPSFAQASEGIRPVRVTDGGVVHLPGYLEIADASCWRIDVTQGQGKDVDGWRVRFINREQGVTDDGMDDLKGGTDRTHHADRSIARGVSGGADVGDVSAESGGEWTDNVPVRVSFELGAMTVPLATLQRWREGSILSFPAPLQFRDSPYANDRLDAQAAVSSNPAAADLQDASDTDGTQDTDDARPGVLVRIRVNGAPLGMGELVDIDGQLGVSVLRLFAAGAGGSGEVSGAVRRPPQGNADVTDAAETEAPQ